MDYEQTRDAWNQELQTAAFDKFPGAALVQRPFCGHSGKQEEQDHKPRVHSVFHYILNLSVARSQRSYAAKHSHGVEDVETVVKHHKKHCKAAQIVNPDASHF